MNRVKIIGGTLRGRFIQIAPKAAVRPTLGRVRETLFNWLQGEVPHARCLDLFAGTGALGFEALSRGADHVTFVDNNPLVLQQLLANQQKLGLTNIEIIAGKVPERVPIISEIPFDLVFVDPPYQQALAAPALHWLRQQLWLNQQSIIYLETERRLAVDLTAWQVIKSSQTARIKYYLLKKT